MGNRKKKRGSSEKGTTPFLSGKELDSEREDMLNISITFPACTILLQAGENFSIFMSID